MDIDPLRFPTEAEYLKKLEREQKKAAKREAKALAKSGGTLIPVEVQETSKAQGVRLGSTGFERSDSGHLWVPVGGGRQRLMTIEEALRFSQLSRESSSRMWEPGGFYSSKKVEEKKPPPPPRIQNVDINELVAKLREKGVVIPDQLVMQVAASPERLVALGTTDSRGYEAQTAAAHLIRLAEAGHNYDTTPNAQVVRRLFETLGTDNVQTHGPAQAVLDDLKIPASEPGEQARVAADLAIKGGTQVGYKKRLAPAPEDFPDTISISRYDPAAHIGKVKAREQSIGFYKFIGESLRNYQPAYDPDLQAAIKAGAKPSTDQFQGISAKGPALSKEALQVMGRLHEIGVGGSAQRILARAVDFKVGPADEPLIRPIQALNSAYAIKNVASGFTARLGELSRTAGSDLERALLLKAMGPRAKRLADGDESAMQELELYAGMIRGAPRDVLIERSTVLQKAPEPERSEYEGLFGKWKGSKESGIANLKQQYANSCVAASSLHALGTADPVVTWLLKSEGPIGRRNPLGFQARAEWTILTANISGKRGEKWDIPKPSGLVGNIWDLFVDLRREKGALSWDDTDAIKMVMEPEKSLDNLGLKDGQIETPEDYQLFQKIVADAPRIWPVTQEALEKAAKAYPPLAGHPFSDIRQLLIWGQATQQKPKGIGPDEAGELLLKPSTFVDYNRVKFLYRLDDDVHHSERIAQAVLAGQPVLLRRGDPEDLPENYSHALSVLQVRGPPGKREFLIPDSNPGKAEWFSQERFESPDSKMSYFFGESTPRLGVGRKSQGRPNL